MPVTENLTASLEDYLEAICQIIAEKQAVRPKDIAKRLRVGNSSVTGALRSLADRGLIGYAPYDVITLTDEGRTVAEDVIRRHEVLREFFVSVLAVDATEADAAACQMEHAVPRSILERLVQYAEFVQVCPRAGARWVADAGYRCSHSPTRERCAQCVAEVLDELVARAGQAEHDLHSTGTLLELGEHRKARVLKVGGRRDAVRRMAEMGIAPGALVEVERVAPLGDPVDVKVRGYHLSLRKEEAAGVRVQAL